MTKQEEVQREATNAIYHSSNSLNGTILMSMRMGKTKVIIDYLRKATKLEPISILWIADNKIEVESELRNEFDKWGEAFLFDTLVTVLHRSSLHKVNPVEFGIIIYNECHTITENILEQLKPARKSSKIIGMTGTFPNKQDKQNYLRALGLHNIFYEYLLDKASKEGIISKYNIEIHHLDLGIENNIEVTYKDRATGKKRSFTTSELAQYRNLSKRINDALTPMKAKNLRITRLKSLNTTRTKEAYARKLLKEFDAKGERTIVFGQNSDSVSRITSNVYNSKTGARGEETLKKFKNQELSHIALVRKGGTGTTYHNIHNVILVAPNSSNTNVLQKISRGMLNDKDNDKPLNVIILCHKNTIQKDWIKSALKNLKSKNITHKNIDG